MDLVETKKSSTECRKNRQRLRYGPIDTYHSKELTFDDIIEMYSQQPSGKQTPKKAEITFENVLQEILDNEQVNIVHNNLDGAARSNNSKNARRRHIGNKNFSSKLTEKGRLLWHRPIATCSKKELTFDEIIQMYSQSSEKETARDTEITFVNAVDEVFSSKPTPVNTGGIGKRCSSKAKNNNKSLCHGPISTCHKKELTFDEIIEMYNRQSSGKETAKDTDLTFENVMAEIFSNKPTPNTVDNDLGIASSRNQLKNTTASDLGNDSKYVSYRQSHHLSSSHVQATHNEKSLNIETSHYKPGSDFSQTFQNEVADQKQKKSTYLKSYDSKEKICDNYKAEYTGNIALKPDKPLHSANIREPDIEIPCKSMSFKTLVRILQETERAKNENMLGAHEIGKQEQPSKSDQSSVNPKNLILSTSYPFSSKVPPRMDYKNNFECRHQNKKPGQPLEYFSYTGYLNEKQNQGTLIPIDLKTPYNGKTQQDNSLLCRPGVRLTYSDSKDFGSTKNSLSRDRSSFKHKNVISSTSHYLSSKVAPSNDYKNDFESRPQQQQQEQPLEDFNYVGYLNEKQNPETLISRGLTAQFIGIGQQDNSLLCQPRVSLTHSPSKGFDSAKNNLPHQKLKDKLKLNLSRTSKNATEQFSGGVQIEVPPQCRPFSYLVDALRKSEYTSVNNNVSSEETANSTNLVGDRFSSCKTTKTDGNDISTLEKADIMIFHSVPSVCHFTNKQTLPGPKPPTTTDVCQEQNKLQAPEVEQKTASKTPKWLNLKLSEECTFINGIGISERTLLENAFLGKDSESQSCSLSQPKCCDTAKQVKLEEAAQDDVSSKLFNKEALQSIIGTLRISQHTTGDNDCENNLSTENKTNFRKKYIKRYKQGKTKIYQITVARRKRKALTEKCANNLSVDEIVNMMSQKVENPSHETEVVCLPRPASFETDASKSECLSTGSADNLETTEKHLRKGLNVISKDRSLLFSGSDYVLQSQNKDKIIMQIQEILLQVWDDMVANKSPHLTVRKQSYENCVFHDNMLQLKPLGEAIMSVIHYKYSPSKLKFCLIMYLLNRIRILLETNTQLTKREIYYQLKDLIAKQGLIDSAINTISCLLDVGPWNLNILAQKGLVYGNLKIRFTSGNVLNCSIPGVLIPSNLDEIIEIESQSYFILVVEKEAIYHKLLQEDLPNRLTRPFILVTGKGYPDLNTQLFLKKLWIIMSIPVFILVDGDFHGISIMLNYRYGSLRNAHLSQYLAIPNAKWIGVRPSEMVRLGITRQALTDREKNLISNLMQSPYMANNPIIKAELKVLLDHGYKGGIEGLIKEHNYLSEMYLPYKFYTQDYI